MSDHKQINKRIQYKAFNYQQLYSDALTDNYMNDKTITTTSSALLHNIYLNNNKIDKTKIQNLPQNDWINRDILDSISLRNNLWHQTKCLSSVTQT